MHFPIVKQAQAIAKIVVSNDTHDFELWVAREIQRYVRVLAGAELEILTCKQAESATSPLLLLGRPATHTRLAQLNRSGDVHFDDLPAEGFILKTVTHGASTQLIVGGNDERAIMYAAYELIERMGVMFQFTHDILPEIKPDLSLPPLDVRYVPSLAYRGFHTRHFVMPWMGYEELCQLIDQMAKMKCNYLEFYWYEGAPWLTYSHRDVQRIIGDLYSPESGYTAWWTETFAFSTDDVMIGKSHFTELRPCAPEFQSCQTAEEAHLIARNLLNRMIAYAHSRKIEVWLGAGDCPAVPPNLGRPIKSAKPADIFGYMIPPGDPSGVEIWSAIMQSMVDTYPEADGYWLWLAEWYFEMSDEESKKVLAQYQDIEHLYPSKQQLLAMGYDQYVQHVSESELKRGDIGLMHYGKEVISQIQQACPDVKFGVTVLGRSYLFPALDALLPKNVRFQSMESAVCWNRNSRIPMENFAQLQHRELILVPRLDDDENQLAVQFNIGTYEHDRMLSASVAYEVSGVIPQIGKTRGSEQNARYFTLGSWEPQLTTDDFYKDYVVTLYGEQASHVMLAAYRLLDEQELFLGLQVNADEVGHFCFQGMGNFFNYVDSRDIGWLKLYRKLTDLASGMNWLDVLGSQQQMDTHFQSLRYRLQRFSQSIMRLEEILTLLEQAKSLVRSESQSELTYLIVKTTAYQLHLSSCCALVQGMLDLEAAYQAGRQQQPEQMMNHLKACEASFQLAYERSMQTAHTSASWIDHPSERHILFRYNVRQLLPIREFQPFIRNIVNFHHGRPHEEHVRWEIIDPRR